LWLSGIIFSGFGMLYQEKSGNPAANFGCWVLPARVDFRQSEASAHLQDFKISHAIRIKHNL
jgi:hypothetical protein